MTKRNLFVEIAEGFEALADERTGKRTLHMHEVEWLPAPGINNAADIIALRKRLNLSRPLFARYLCTLENWEQGRAKPNAQTALLIRWSNPTRIRLSGWLGCR